MVRNELKSMDRGEMLYMIITGIFMLAATVGIIYFIVCTARCTREFLDVLARH